jgi:alanine-synthesizing transaminase
MNKTNSIIPAKKTHRITYAIRDIILLADQIAKTGKEMLYLNIGDPNVYDHTTPRHIIEATYKAMLENKNGYSPSSGIKSALESIERDAEKKGINNILDIFITTGASEAIEICLTALLNAGENFLMPTPGYPLYTAVQSKLELEPNPYYLNEENGWQPDIEDISSKINDKTRAIVIINPNNPTGSIANKETLLKIIDLAQKHNLLIIADEIYDKLLFDGEKHISIASLNKDVSCITFSGLSKNFVVPGFRLGWGIASGRQQYMGEYLEAVNKILRARVCANHPEQYAVPAALEGDQTHIREMVKTLQHRRNITNDMLNKIPDIKLKKPKGAFYAFPSVDVKDDNKFVSELIEKTGVVVVPGTGFGQKPATSHFRVVILPPEDVLKKAYELIGNFLTEYKE